MRAFFYNFVNFENYWCTIEVWDQMQAKCKLTKKRPWLEKIDWELSWKYIWWDAFFAWKNILKLFEPKTKVHFERLMIF